MKGKYHTLVQAQCIFVFSSKDLKGILRNKGNNGGCRKWRSWRSRIQSTALTSNFHLFLKTSHGV